MTLFGLIAIFGLIFGAFVCVAYLISLVGSQEKKKALSRLEAISQTVVAGVGSETPLDVRREAPASSMPWLNDLLSRLDLAPRLRLLLVQAGLDWNAEKILSFMLIAFVLVTGLVFLRTDALGLSLVLGILSTTTPLFYLYWKRGRRFDRFRELLPETLDTMVAAIRAGHSFHSALGMTAREAYEPVRGELRQCFDEQNFGLDLRSSLDNLEHRLPIADIRIMVAAIIIQRETGGNLTEILERVAYLIREEFRLQRQVRVHTAQGRMTGWILSILPVALGLLLYLFNPGHMKLLWTRSIGLKMLYSAAAMTTIGALIIRKIVRVRF